MKRSRVNMTRTSQGPGSLGKNSSLEEGYADVETRVQTSPTYQLCLAEITEKRKSFFVSNSFLLILGRCTSISSVLLG